MKTLLLLVCGAFICAGAPPPGVHIAISGGLLGHSRGFCELPQNAAERGASVPLILPSPTSCPPGRVPYGGLLGLQTYVDDAADAGAYTLLAGNNFPKDFDIPVAGGPHQSFWDELGATHTDVIAVGQDDLLRMLLPAVLDGGKHAPPPIQARLAFLGDGRFPFLATNAALRTHRKGINTVKSSGYELLLSADDTVPWTAKEFQIRLPAFVRKGGSYRVSVCGSSAALVNPENESLKVKARLQPDAICEIKVDGAWSNPDSQQDVRFAFRVDAAVTPRPNAAGFPVAMLEGKGAPVMVAAMIDPAVRTSLAPNRWSSEPRNGETVELVLLPPDEAAADLLTRTAGSTSIPVLMTDMADALVLKVLRQSNRWRLVSLNPDSAVLGCGSGRNGCGKGRDVDYAFGDYSVTGAATDHALVTVRPEWLAETMISVDALSQDKARWQGATASLTVVDGYVRQRSAPNVLAARTTQTFYSGTGTSRAYRMPPQRAAAPVWWHDRSDVANALMAAMRERVSAEIAFADLKMMDDDVVKELLEEARNGMIQQVTYAQLMDIFWRHDTYVRAIVNGSDLTALLGKLRSLPADDDGGFCAWGLRTDGNDFGCSIPKTIGGRGRL